MAVTVVTRASFSLFVVSTIVRKGRSVFLMSLCEPCDDVFKWMVLRVQKRGLCHCKTLV